MSSCNASPSLVRVPRRQSVFALLALLAASAVPGASVDAASAPADPAFDFVTHNDVLIAATPEQIWPVLRDVNSWKAGAKATRFDGGTDVVGERFKAAPPKDPESFYFIETVELAAPSRWTVRLTAKNGELMGYAMWTLMSAQGGTRVRYDTFLRSRLPPDTAPQDAARIGARTNQEASERMDAEFSSLKQLVEKSIGAR